jgi:uncharacterized protein YkwD
LAEVARAHAHDIAARGYASHVTPEGKTLRDRLEGAGLFPGWAGENYCLSHRPTDEAVATALVWYMRDPPHRDNILHKRYTCLGVGVAQKPQGSYVLVLDFAGQ